MARFKLRRGSKEGGDPAPDETVQQPATSEAPAGPAPTGEPTAGSESEDASGAGPSVAEAAPLPEPSVAERLEGQRSWLAQLDRRIGVRTYAGAAALVIALAAAAVALVLVIQLQDDSATDADVQQLSEQITDVEAAATEAAEDDVASLTDRLGELEGQISSINSDQSSLDRQVSTLQDDIQDLRDQISDLEDQGGAGNNP